MDEAVKLQLVCVILLVVFGIVCSEDGKNRQTFVVRYKNGDQTIPVTVVLDHRKQTEYVINMSPRTSAKSMTLYDFKQRTIAYKDLTNRECFLGRLTHESLSEESDALNRVQNPVDHKPKVLSLDPQKTALTPTEIRNMAGQKTAVFCRKMNTWLILPQESHSIKKRDVDDVEVDEHTFHRHGYHTVRYSHYGKETRRRYRTSRRNATRQLSHRNRDASTKVASPEVKASGLPSIESPISNFNTFPRGDIDENVDISPFHPHNQNPHFPKEEKPNHLPPTFPPYSHHEQNPSFSSYANFYDENSNGSSSPGNHETLDVFDSQPSDAFSDRSHGVLNSLLENDISTPDPTNQPENLPDPTYPEVYDKGIEGHYHGHSAKEPELQPPGRTYDQNSYSNRQIETESFLNELHKKTYPDLGEEHVGQENELASTNMLESPKKFEKLEQGTGPGIAPQPNEDLHDVFEGFYNLSGSHPGSSAGLHNSYFIPPEINKFDEHSYSEDPIIQSNPIIIPNYFRNSNASIWQSWGNVYTPLLHRTSSIPSPTLTTAIYDYNTPITYPTDTDTPTTHIDGRFRGSHLNRNVLLKVFDPSKDTDYNENLVQSITTTTFPPLPPFKDSLEHKPSHQRSDIPSESDQDEDIENYTSTATANGHIHQQGSSVVPTTIVKEGVSLHQQRFHNILRHYKPDQIVIDIENIPTRLPPDSNLGFHERLFPTIKSTTVIPFLNTIRTTVAPRIEQAEAWPRNHTQNARRPSRRRGTSFQNHQWNNVVSHPLNKPGIFPHRGYNYQPLGHYSRSNYPRQFNDYHNPHPPLGSLPPGVSVHPRHPKAPYADLFHPNVLQASMAQTNNLRTLKPHRQRHHRKKDRFHQPRDGKSSCCRDRTSAHRGEDRLKHSCCSGRGNKNLRIPTNGIPNVVPSRTFKKEKFGTLPLLQSDRMPSVHASQQRPRTVEDARNRCEKQKMCRTLYESTQQVMVCRSAQIEGC